MKGGSRTTSVSSTSTFRDRRRFFVFISLVFSTNTMAYSARGVFGRPFRNCMPMLWLHVISNFDFEVFFFLFWFPYFVFHEMV